MDIKSDYGSICIFDKEMQKKQRVKNLRKTVYNFGMGVEEELKGKNWVPWLCSLTYKDVKGWNPNDIKFFLNRVRVHLARRKIKFIYVWVAELQKRGALHYHLCIWLPKGFRLPKFQRYGWWNHGFTDQKIALKGVGYLMKYISKDESKHDYPKGVRIYGYGGCSNNTKRRIRFFRCNATIRREIQASGLSWVDVDMRKTKGGKVCYLTGWFFESKWKVWMVNNTPIFLCVHEPYKFYHLFLDFQEKMDYYALSV